MAKATKVSKVAELLRGVKFKTWSPSALRDYESCPRKAALDRIVKLCVTCFTGSYRWMDGVQQCSHCGGKPPAPGEALQRGTVIHAAAEAYISKRPGQAQPAKPRKGDVYLGTSATKLKGSGYLDSIKYPFDLTNVRKDLVGADGIPVPGLDSLRKAYTDKQVRVELDLAFTKDWRLTQWMAKDVYVRFKLDVIHFLGKLSSITDWKTGRYKPEEEFDDQLNGYAVATLTAGFGDETRAQLIFTDQGQVVTTEDAGKLKRSDLPKAQKAMDARAKRLFVDTTFPPRPGNSCRWCAFSTNRGGPCEY
jgi:hypothetical protein